MNTERIKGVETLAEQESRVRLTELSESMEELMLTLHRFASKRAKLRSVTANLGRSQKESVKITQGLHKRGLVCYPEFGYIALTQKGERIADILYLRQEAADKLLTLMNGAPPDKKERKKVARAFSYDTAVNLYNFISKFP